MKIHPRLTFILMALLTGAIAKATPQPHGCLIHESWGPDKLSVQEGTISQSFQPCSDGEVVYLHLYVRSTDATSFSTKMWLTENPNPHRAALGTQQVVIPSNSQKSFVSINMTHPVQLDAGKKYWIHLAANEDHEFDIQYSKKDDYPDGEAYVSGVKIAGDLAFELGMRYPETTPKQLFKVKNAPECVLKNSFGEEAISNRPWSMEWKACKDIEINSIGVQSNHATSSEALVSFYIKNELGQRQWIDDINAVIRPGQSDFKTILLSKSIEIKSGETLLVELEELNEWGVSYIGKQDNGKVDFNYWINPVQWTDWTALKDQTSDCAQYSEELVKLHESEDELLIQSFTACTEGHLERIVIPGNYYQDASFDWFIRDQNELILAEGTCNQKDLENGAMVIEDLHLPVILDAKYDLVVVTGETPCNLFMSNEGQHPALITETGTKKLPLFFGIEYKSLMIELEEVQDQVSIKLYPNPFVDRFSVALEGKQAQASISIFDFQGKEIFKELLSSDENLKEVVLPANLLPGYYTVRVDTQGQVFLETIIKK